MESSRAVTRGRNAASERPASVGKGGDFGSRFRLLTFKGTWEPRSGIDEGDLPMAHHEDVGADQIGKFRPGQGEFMDGAHR